VAVGIVPQTGTANVLSLGFNGGQSVAIPDDPAFDLTQSLTLEAYIYAEKNNNGDLHQIVFRGDSRSGFDPYWFGFDHTDSDLVFHIENDVTSQSAEVSVVFNEFEQWAHVAGVLDDATGEMSLYIDGTLKAQITTSVRPSGSLAPLLNPGIGIGALQNNGDTVSGYGGEFFYGKIDEVRISGSALSPSEFLIAPAMSVPEPSTLVLAGIGFVCCCVYIRPRRGPRP
jgi:hypothetical protein